jgi:hypothetical protein
MSREMSECLFIHRANQNTVVLDTTVLEVKSIYAMKMHARDYHYYYYYEVARNNEAVAILTHPFAFFLKKKSVANLVQHV